MLKRLFNYLQEPVDILPLALFRIIFGFLLAAESIGAIFTGWVKRTFIDPEFTFTFIGFEFLQAPDGYFMYGYYLLMGIAGILVMLGYRYRISLFVFLIMWCIVYLMQKSNYNNHYYLLILLCSVMLFLPANRFMSLDARRNADLQLETYPQFYRWLLILQLWVVYTYASIAKMNADWFAAKPIGIWFKGKSNYFLIGGLLQEEWFQLIIAYGGVVFDLLIIPLLLIKRTRTIAFFVGVFFHLFNSFVFQIGIFPYLMIGLCIFFFPPETVRRVFRFKVPDKLQANDLKIPAYLKLLAIVYFAFMIILPIRHHFIAGDVNCTEEGHRMSWRMMLRQKSGSISFRIVEDSGNTTIVKPITYMTMDQYHSMATKPDMIWQFAQRLKKEYKSEGKNVQIYADAFISVNGSRRVRYIDPQTDLGNERWDRYRHSAWILPCR